MMNSSTHFALTLFLCQTQDYPELLSFKPCKKKGHSGVKALEGKVKCLFFPLSAWVPQGYQYFTRLRAREDERHAQSTVAEGEGEEEERGGGKEQNLSIILRGMPPQGTFITYSQYSV